MARTGLLFVGVIWALGVVTGLAIAAFPERLGLVPVPALTVPLLVGLLLDLALRPATEAGRIAPVSMGERATAVIGAALLAIAIEGLAGR